jgi:protocatechuate 3,4-dioxygenase beta subunit
MTRREAIGGLGIGSAAAGLLAGTATGIAQTSPPAPPGVVCTLFPESFEGPFYFDPRLVRADIAEKRQGLPMSLALRIVESGTCRPIANARVDIWQADASGVYSGYAGQGDRGNVSTRNETFLRGTQHTDAAGGVTFQTIFPGWYPGRTPHVHVKAFLDRATLVTGQVYFPDELSARIFREREPYARRSRADTSNRTDGIFGSSMRAGGGIVLAVREEPGRLDASLTIAVDRSRRPL